MSPTARGSRPTPGRRGGRGLRAAAAALAALAAGAAACGTALPDLDAAPGVASQYSAPARYTNAQPALGATTTVSGVLRAPGGPYIRDASGRVVFLHGVNVVYKHPPYELTVTPGKAWSFTAADASRIADLGFNVVRLGILWEGLEPGTGGPNQPAICTPGKPGNPHMYNARAADAYLAQVAKVVDLLGRHHVYTLLDMHQDVYSQVFRGEGAPAWAVCTDQAEGAPITALGGRWSTNYRNPLLDVAVRHFWNNDVVGDLQGEFDRVWGTVARYFRDNEWVAGYDPYNEPFSTSAVFDDGQHFAAHLECFYTGRLHPGALDIDEPIVCPPGVPAEGVIPTIEAADTHHLVFAEPDNYTIRHGKGFDLIGPMDYRRLVYNFHVYCGQRSPVTGDPVDLHTCVDHEVAAIVQRMKDRAHKATPDQPGGPAWFMSEFGATHSLALVSAVTAYAEYFDLGWAYWSWKYYDDPTGSSFEALVNHRGRLEATVDALSRTYPQAVAGTPTSVRFDPAGGDFSFTYTPAPRVHAPTVVFVADRHYPHGYCTEVTGGQVLSVPGSTHLLVRADPGARSVQVRVEAGRCAAG
ncbi:MAG: cellulase family glycosylhydrolase [Acidimicrobiales bacterium]